jgi:hypothetical protein
MQEWVVHEGLRVMVEIEPDGTSGPEPTACGAPDQPGLADNHAPTGTSDPNVKMDLTET